MLALFPRDAGGNQSPHFYHNQGPIIVGVNCMMAVLCFAAIIGRASARRIRKVEFQADDYLAFIAFVTDHLCKTEMT